MKEISLTTGPNLLLFCFQLYDERKLHYRRLATRYSMKWTIIGVSRYLLDMNCLFENNLAGVWDWEEREEEEEDEDNSCYQFWLAVFELSKTPLAIELKEKVQNSGIPYKTFCRSIVKVCFELKRRGYFGVPGIRVTPDDVSDTVKDLNLNRIQYESVKILFSLHKIHSLKI